MLVIIYEQYTLEDKHSYEKPPTYFKELDSKVFETALKQPNTKKAIAHLWGMQETSHYMQKIEDQKDKVKETSQLLITQDKNSLCIEKSCYRLLGFYKQNRAYVSFFNKDLEPKIITITLGDTLNSHVELTSIKDNVITLSECNTTRSWEFKLFDVNATKYQPKKELQ